jgi:hypothetical protein
MARRPNQLRPIAVISKIIRVESAEVVYHDVVIAEREDHDSGNWYKSEYLEWSREALERSIGQTVVDLQRAFQ